MQRMSDVALRVVESRIQEATRGEHGMDNQKNMNEEDMPAG